MESHPDDHGAVDRGIELAVTAMVDPVFAARCSRSCWDGADAGEFG